jgi:hypothetical protein
MAEITLSTGSLTAVSFSFRVFKSTHSQPISGMVNPIAELTWTAQSLTLQNRNEASNEDVMDMEMQVDASGSSSVHDESAILDDQDVPEQSSADQTNVQRQMTIASPEPSDSSDSSGDEGPSIREESAKCMSHSSPSH